MRRPNKTIPTHKDLHFPKAGIDVSQPFHDQPVRQQPDGEYARTTPLAVNVRAWDAQESRSRGGSREGYSKWASVRPWGGDRWVLQDMSVLVTVGGDPVQPSLSGRKVNLITVQVGNVYTSLPPLEGEDPDWLAATNISSGTPPLNATGIMFSAPNIGKTWFADGINYRYFDPENNTVNDWTTSVAGVPLPEDEDGNTPTLIETWLGRTLLAGIEGEPEVLYGSAVDEPRNYQTSPPQGELATRAFALTVGGQGLVGDVITGMIPFRDDKCVIGTDHELHLLAGDPAAGGRRDVISKSIGLAWGRAWCEEPNGRIWFFSNRTGIYTMMPGSAPQHVSWPVNKLLEDVDTGTNIIRMIWDHRNRSVKVYITPTQASVLANTHGDIRHYEIETRQGAYFQTKFKSKWHNPLCLVALDGNEPGDRVILLGCWDGFVRKVDPTATMDDGFPIEQEVLIGPMLTREMDELRLDQLQGVLSQASGVVNVSLLLGNSAEAALASTPVPIGTLRGGRGYTLSARRSAYAVFVRLTSTDRWAMEQIRVLLAPLGKIRRRGR